MQKHEATDAVDILPVRTAGGGYNIVLSGSFAGLADAAASAGAKGKRICIVTDSSVAPLYADAVKEALAGCCREVFCYVLPAGEENKTLDNIRGIYTFLIENGFDRGDLLAALGGGVTGDMTGFAAATYLRGIRFIQIPTTLLAQVDSSIGGKTGVDFDRYKNMVGAFHQPSLVYMNLSTLYTLPEEQFACGMGEILKHGLIRDRAYYDWLEKNAEGIRAKEFLLLLAMIRRSCEIKRDVVEEDPTEKGVRAILNFGHTIGHAVEKVTGLSLLHGQCVAIGSLAAMRLCVKRGLLSGEEAERAARVNGMFGLPLSAPEADPEAVAQAVRHDKKMNAGQIRFILLRAIGEAYADDTVTAEEILYAAQCAAGRETTV